MYSESARWSRSLGASTLPSKVTSKSVTAPAEGKSRTATTPSCQDEERGPLFRRGQNLLLEEGDSGAINLSHSC